MKLGRPSEAIEERARQRASGERQDEPAQEPSAELQAIREEMLRQHWTGWLDTRVPALGNKTPRQAARTAGGRERLEALLAEFERYAAGGPASIAAAHLTEIRGALGLTKAPGSGEDTRLRAAVGTFWLRQLCFILSNRAPECGHTAGNGGRR